MENILNFRSGIPIYIQIMEQIKQKVASGDLTPGSQLPTVRAMAANLQVNFNTVARAYRLLDHANLITTQQGRGTYILQQPSDESMQRLRQDAFEELTRHYLSGSTRLGYTPEETILMINQMTAEWKAGLQPVDQVSE